jgi:hypothetical protein
MQTIDRGHDAQLSAMLVIFARCKVGSEQEIGTVDIREQSTHVIYLFVERAMKRTRIRTQTQQAQLSSAIPISAGETHSNRTPSLRKVRNTSGCALALIA